MVWVVPSLPGGAFFLRATILWVYNVLRLVPPGIHSSLRSSFLVAPRYILCMVRTVGGLLTLYAFSRLEGYVRLLPTLLPDSLFTLLPSLCLLLPTLFPLSLHRFAPWS